MAEIRVGRKPSGAGAPDENEQRRNAQPDDHQLEPEGERSEWYLRAGPERDIGKVAVEKLSGHGDVNHNSD